MIDNQTKEQILSRTNEVLNSANAMFKANLAGVKITFDLKGHTAGMALCSHGQMALRYNQEAIAKNFQDYMQNTIPHEVAHLVIFALTRSGRFYGKRIMPHGREWRTVCQRLGGDGSRTHSMALTAARKSTRRRFKYVVNETGEEFLISAQKHNKVQAGSRFRSLRTGALILAHHFVSVKIL